MTDSEGWRQAFGEDFHLEIIRTKCFLHSAISKLYLRMQDRLKECGLFVSIKSPEKMIPKVKKKLKRTKPSPKKPSDENSTSRLDFIHILSAITEHVVYHDTQNRIIWANKAAGDSMGVDPELLVGQYCYEVWHKRKKPCAGCPVIKALKTKKMQTAEITTPDGRVWWIRGYPVIDTNGNVEGLIETTQEITEQKKAEESLKESEGRFRSLVENSPMGIWQDDVDKRTVYANKAILDMLEIENENEIADKDWQSFFPPESLAIIEREHEKRFKGIASSYEVEIIGKKEGRRNVVIYGTPLFSPDGKLTGTIATFFDITGHKEMEKELRKKMKELEEFYDMAVGRELRMKELKKENEALRKELEKSK